MTDGAQASQTFLHRIEQYLLLDHEGLQLAGMKIRTEKQEAKFIDVSKKLDALEVEMLWMLLRLRLFKAKAKLERERKLEPQDAPYGVKELHDALQLRLWAELAGLEGTE